MTVLCCAAALLSSLPRYELKSNGPVIERIACHRLLITLICSWIFSQLVTGLIDRPMEIITNLRFQSILACQIIGFLFSLFCAFVFGVLFTVYPGVYV